MFLQIPKYLPENRNLHCIISPRSHHAETLEKIRTQTYQTSSYFARTRTESFQEHLSNHKQTQNNYEYNLQKDVDIWTRPFQLLVNSKSTHLKHSRSLSSQSPQNKFYSFKKIRQQKCKEQNFGGKVVKSLKINPQNEKPTRKKVIQHLDEVTTIQSKNSPRSSLNSLAAPQIQESQIIMKGADLYEDLLKQNSIGKSIIFGQTKMVNSIFQTPEVRKQLCESNYWTNRQNRLNNHGNCMTDPRKVLPFDQQDYEQERKNLHSFLRHLNPANLDVDRNKLSFLKVKKEDKRY